MLLFKGLHTIHAARWVACRWLLFQGLHAFDTAQRLCMQPVLPKGMHAVDAAQRLSMQSIRWLQPTGCMEFMLLRYLHAYEAAQRLCVQSLLPEGLQAVDAANRLHGVYDAYLFACSQCCPRVACSGCRRKHSPPSRKICTGRLCFSYMCIQSLSA